MAKARDLFVTKGYRGTSVADVARAAGVAGNAVHWYFPTKDDLFAAVLDSLFADLEQATAAMDGSPKERLIRVLDSNQRFRGLHRDAYERMAGSESVRRVLAKAQGWLNQLLLEAVQYELPEGTELGSVADFAQVLIEGMCVSERPIDRSVEEFIDLLVEALVALTERRQAAVVR
ncbi:TetR/AcrR family transcriptional regulator [Mycolicibacterium phlei]